MTDLLPNEAAINGSTKLMGLLGEKIDYTLSPRIHNFSAKFIGVNAAYLPMPMAKADVKPFLDLAWRLGALGFNVTTPYKDYVAELFPGSGKQSVNTIYRGKDGWKVTSTDAEGFVRGLARLGRDFWTFKKLVLIGSGGVALALVELLAHNSLGPCDVVVLRRHSANDRRIKGLLTNRGCRFEPLTLAALSAELGGKGEETLLVQATSGPQSGDDLAYLVPAMANFGGVVVDLVYGRPSALYINAKSNGLKSQDGEAMLIEQARLAQELWWKKAAPFEKIAAALHSI